ncbi:MAG: MFS transporter [Clostridium sp.]|nr:MFS transporter [Clostridium sp.]
MKKINLLKNKNFMFLWFGQSISQLGDSVYAIAIMWYVMLLTGSTVQMGISLVFSTVPTLIFVAFAGVIADKINRKKILICCNLISAVVISIMFVASINSKLSITFIYTVSFLIASTAAFFSPAKTAVVPSIVKKEDLPAANSMNQITTSLCGIIGPSIAGVLIAVVGVKSLFLVNSISFLLAAICEMFINVPLVKKKENKREDNILKAFLNELKEGFMYCKKIKALFYFMVIAGFLGNCVAAPLDIYIPIYSSKILKMGSSAYGMLMAFVSVGTIISSIIFPRISKKSNLYYKATVAFIGEGIFFCVLGLSNNFIEAMFSMIMLGVSFGFTNISLGLAAQLSVSNEFMGRVSSIFNTMATFVMPLGYFIGGLVCAHFPVGSILLVSGVLLTILGFSTIKITIKNTITIPTEENCAVK